MILTVTPNPALDITYTVPKLVVGETNRPATQHERAGGKGVNVARVLHALGEPVVALGLAGGNNGELIAAELTEAGLPHEMAGIRENSRRTVNFVSTVDGAATIMNEPGPLVSTGEWRAFLDLVAGWLPRAEAVVLSGSLPPGVSEAGFADLVKLTAAQGLPSILDTSGPALLTGLAAGPSMIKPNQHELRWLAAAISGERPRDPQCAIGPLSTLFAESAGTSPLRAARALQRRYSCAVIASLGAHGLLAAGADGSWRAAPPERISGNPVGAGDACVAALAVGLAHEIPLPDSISAAVALSSAAVRRTLAGDVDLDYYRTHQARITITEEP